MTGRTARRLVASIDIGGTFTDCVVRDGSGAVVLGKALSSPGDDFQSGFFDSLAAAVRRLGYKGIDDALADAASVIAHGSTVATNIVVEGDGARVGLITTKGHEDTLAMMRGEGRIMGEPPEAAFEFVKLRKPTPLLPRERIRGAVERVDSRGQVLVPLDEGHLEQQIRELVALGCEAYAVCLLWSIQYPEHERRVREILSRVDPGRFVSLSHEISKAEGEYERTVATVIDAYVGPRTQDYLKRLNVRLKESGFRPDMMVMQCHGGVVSVEDAARTPIFTIGSGPVGGLVGTQRLVGEYGFRDLIATDMGGTSFDVGIVKDGALLLANDTVVRKFKFRIPSVEVVSIGAGGGTIARVDIHSKSLRLGPESAGSDPGPACYGLGGSDATVTDANLVLGYLSPEAVFGTAEVGSLQPDIGLAESAIARIAEPLGLSVQEAALGIVEIANNQMANLLENVVVGRGFDPRDFVLVSYGGSGPLHAAGYARAMGVDRVLVPGELASVWSAFGIGASDVRHQVEKDITFLSPFDAGLVASAFAGLTGELEGRFWLGDGDVLTRRYIRLRYQWQQHWLEVPVESGTVSDETIAATVQDFEQRYSERYSAAALLPGARLEIVGLRLEAGRQTASAAPDRRNPLSGASRAEEKMAETRLVSFLRGSPPSETIVRRGHSVSTDEIVRGPAVIDLPTTGIVVPPQCTARRTAAGDFLLRFSNGRTA